MLVQANELQAMLCEYNNAKLHMHKLLKYYNTEEKYNC